MANSAFAHQTNRGRIVYDRKLHQFTGKDAVSVASSFVDKTIELQPSRAIFNRRERLFFVLKELIWREVVKVDPDATRFVIDLAVEQLITPLFTLRDVQNWLDSLFSPATEEKNNGES